MKKALLTILSLSSALLVCGQASYESGDTLYVWAMSGVNVRSSPGGEIVSSLSYGTPVVVRQREYKSQSPVEVIPSSIVDKKKYPAFNIYGQYQEVSFNDGSGYIFDAYLSRFPPIRCEDNPSRCENIEEYFSREFGQLKLLKNSRGLDSDDKHLQVVYHNGLIYEQSIGKATEVTMIIPGMSMLEAFLFANKLHKLEGRVEPGQKSKTNYFLVLKNTTEQSNPPLEYLEFVYEAVTVSIRRIGGYIIITYYGSC